MRAMSRRTKARAARLYNERNVAALDVSPIEGSDESGVIDEGCTVNKPVLRGNGVVLVDFAIVVVAVGIEEG